MRTQPKRFSQSEKEVTNVFAETSRVPEKEVTNVFAETSRVPEKEVTNVFAETSRVPEKEVTNVFAETSRVLSRIPHSDLLSSLEKLEKMLKDLRLARTLTEQCCEFLKQAKEAVNDGNTAEITNQMDLFVLTIQRNMGTVISLGNAFNLVDVAIIDVKRPVGDPGQIFQEAQRFSQRFMEIASVSHELPE